MILGNTTLMLSSFLVQTKELHPKTATVAEYKLLHCCHGDCPIKAITILVGIKYTCGSYAKNTLYFVLQTMCDLGVDVGPMATCCPKKRWLDCLLRPGPDRPQENA